LLWIRGLLFTLIAPGIVGAVIPYLIYKSNRPQGAWWNYGWILIVAGAAIYLWCLLRFLSSGGTPAIFFTRPLRFLIGEEPNQLIRQGPYLVSRNPMYLGVLLAVAGQAMLFASIRLVVYCAGLWLFFQIVIVGLEEPHLRRERGPAYEQYHREVPRWFGWPR
jgi:protein-S-isoprenylcysteine O-methyltransferase Ste14